MKPNKREPQPGVMSVFQVAPRRIGGVEMLAAESTTMLRALNWRSILVFPIEPSEKVKDFFEQCGAEVLVRPKVFRGGLAGALAFYSVVRETQSRQISLSFVPLLSLLPWAGRLAGANDIFFTDQNSRKQGETPIEATPMRRMLGRLLASPYKRVFCTSDFVRRDNVVRGYIPEQRLTTLHNSVDFRRTAPANKGKDFRRRLGIRPDQVLISQVSWVRPEKGIEDFLRAAALASAEVKNMHFLVVGDAHNHEDFAEQCKQLCRELGIEKSVTFCGLIEDPMLEGVYDASDITCQLSRWEEAFGWVIAEAMTHAKPVIATRVGGIPETIDDGVTGYLVPCCNPKAVAERMVNLSRDANLRRRMGNAGYQKAYQQFNLTDNVSQLLAAFGAFKENRVPEAAVAVNVG